MNPVLFALVAIHLVSAALLVGGSLFIWLVAVPASRTFGLAEAERTRIIGVLAKRFGPVVYASLAALLTSGLALALLRIGSVEALVGTPFGRVLAFKAALVVVLLFTLYLHNVVYGRQISAHARAGRTEELQRVRRRSRPVAYFNVALLLLIFLLGVVLHYAA
ncbi:MAG: CopD family protein [Euryarchaeota archaeon]|nr:CopD family protein [Euryarchaeota archaeon]